MIRPKTVRPSRADEADAYELATLRDNNVCQRCRRVGRVVHRDHRQNRQSGNTVVSNLQLLCAVECHPWKSEHPQKALAEGWAVPSFASPSEWPARRFLSSLAGLRLTWVLYGDDGGVTEISAAEARQRMGGLS